MAETAPVYEIDARLLRAWPLPQPDGQADKEQRLSEIDDFLREATEGKDRP